MDINITEKQMKELCGTVSYKKGQTFYQTGKVMITEMEDLKITAVVKSTEDFHVTILKTTSTKDIQTSCSCERLIQFTKKCQHVAAVLIAMQQKQQKEWQHQEKLERNNELFSIFDEQQTHGSGYQRHFEQRETLALQFVLTPMELTENERLFTMRLKVEDIPIRSIRPFLQAVSQARAYKIAPQFTYDQSAHCFEANQNKVLQQLTEIIQDEVLYVDAALKEDAFHLFEDMLFIPPSAWQKLAPKLAKEQEVVVQSNRELFHRFHYKEAPSPLAFYVEKLDHQYVMRLPNLENALLFESYHALLMENKLYTLSTQSTKQVKDLQQLFAKQPQFVIEEKQLHHFLDVIVPKLKKIGHVEIAKDITKEQMTIPLQAKLYLDRVNNRLLAGLEFHYGQFFIQPLEDKSIADDILILRDFEKEAAILQVMDESGFTKTEGGYYMQNDELEYQFLYHTLPNLQKLAQIYTTNSVKLRIAKENNFPKIRVNVQHERTNWLEFKFEMDGVTNKQIKEILTGLTIKQKFYRLANGALLSLETHEMEEIARFLRAIPTQDEEYELTFNMPILEGLPFLEQFEQSEIFEAEESFQLFTQQLLQPEVLAFDVPESLEPVLRDYQKHGYSWLKLLANYGFGGVLADDMGLGKTIQSIAYIVSELEIIRANKQPVLIVCPSSLAYNWLYEMIKFAPEIEAIIVDGSTKERRELLTQLDTHDVVITTYPLLRRDSTFYERQHFHTVFFDEAQAFKNPLTQTARTVKKIRATNRFGLTGTPIENSLAELWSIYRVIFPQLFGALEEFKHMQRKDIARRVRPFLLRRMKEDVLLELPGKEETLDFSELLPEQKALYAAFLAKLREDTMKHLDKETFQQNKIRILAGITRLRQICCHPALFVEDYKGSSAKFEQLLRILQEAKNSGRRVLIFSQFTQMLKLIGTELTKRGEFYFYLDGQTPSEERVQLCNAFNEGESDLFLISLKAGGTGLNLTGADTVILYDLWWNPAVEEQAADRAHRMGQKHVVQVIKLIARGTIEEKMNQLQHRKKTLIADILDTEQPATLTEQDIREILMI
ncbi:MAG: DEAD/DEAH box helicase [Solibacillus sp.]